ncbi:MAG: hypothetical protein RJQ07_04405 [Pseudomonadales bacterium]
MATDIIGVVIEFSIGLAGFAGVIALFSGRSSEMLELDLFRIRNLLLGAAIPAFLGFIALGLVHALSNEAHAWTWSLLFSIIFIGLYIFHAIRSRVKMPQPQRVQLQNRIFTFIIVALGALIALQLASMFKVVPIAAFDAFFAGLVSMLAVSTYQFVRAVLQGIRANTVNGRDKSTID